MVAVSHWQDWHEEYNDPQSRLSRRLAAVQGRLSVLLHPGVTLLSLCAGEGRDVIPVLAARPELTGVRALLVELDPVLAARAGEAAAGHPGVEVRGADAGRTDSYADVLPVDVLMLCGIFGNVDHRRVRDIVAAVPAMVTAGGHVIWTRGAAKGGVDLRPEVRRWFVEAGMPEVSFDGEPESYGVGVNRVVSPRPGSVEARARLFDFVR